MKKQKDDEVVEGGVVSEKDKQKIITEATRRGLKIKRQNDSAGGKVMGRHLDESSTT